MSNDTNKPLLVSLNNGSLIVQISLVERLLDRILRWTRSALLIVRARTHKCRCKEKRKRRCDKNHHNVAQYPLGQIPDKPCHLLSLPPCVCTNTDEEFSKWQSNISNEYYLLC